MSIDETADKIRQYEREIAALEKKIEAIKNRRDNAISHFQELQRQETVKSKLRMGYLNVKDAAEYLGITAVRLRSLIRWEDISVERIGGADYISPQELEDIIKGDWLKSTCKGTWSNGKQCPFPVFRDSLFCRVHRPDRPPNQRYPKWTQ